MSEQQDVGAVDFGFLQTYANGDPTFVREVLAIFSAEAREWGPSLQPGAPDWRAIVHTIKGTSRTIGARGLGDLCERAEREGEGLLPQIRAALAEVLARIDAYMAQPD